MTHVLLERITLEELNDTIQEGISNQLKQLQLKDTSTNDDLVTGADIQKEYRVSHTTVNNWKKSGILNPIYVGGRVYYKRSELPHNRKGGRS